MAAITFLLALGLMIIHIVSKYFRFLNAVPRHWFLSISSGIAVAYVFIHLLPELQEYQKKLEENIDQGWFKMLEDHIYLISMIGLAFFYGLELLVRKHRPQHSSTDKENTIGIFMIHMASFFIYNAIIGYLLVQGEFAGLLGKVLFSAAMGVHFITNDWSLRESHKEVYDRYGRWLLAIAILLGWMAGAWLDLPEVSVFLLTAFLVGGIILNVLKEELPEDRQSKITAFFLGVIGYAILLLLQ